MRLCTALLSLGLNLAAATVSAAPTNVLLILANSQNCELGCYGSAAVKTPNLDKLAARGVRFTRAYTQHTIQGPARLSMLTGLKPTTLGVMWNYRYAPELPKNCFTLPRWFKDNGYFTAKAGRIFQAEDYALSWNHALPATGGEEEERELKSTTVVAVPSRRESDAADAQRLGDVLVIRAASVEDNTMPDARAALDGVEQLKKAAASGKPFFVAVGFNTPNFRSAVPKAWLDRYPASEVILPEDDDTSDVPGEAKFGSILPSQPVTAEERKQAIAGYRAMTSFMDAQVGVVLDALDQMKLTDNTVVIFSSMTGFLLGDRGDLWGGRCLFEEVSRVPLIIAGPRADARGQTCQRVVELMDVFPTATELCGLKNPRMMDGASFAALLRQPSAPSADPALTFVQNYGPYQGTALRTEQATFIRWGADIAELYNLQTDPRETKNLAGDKAMAAALRKMESALAKELQKR
jgi:iduronate 2-sulfatase